MNSLKEASVLSSFAGASGVDRDGARRPRQLFAVASVSRLAAVGDGHLSAECRRRRRVGQLDARTTPGGWPRRAGGGMQVSGNAGRACVRPSPSE